MENIAKNPKLLEEGLLSVVEQSAMRTPTYYDRIFKVGSSNKNTEVDFDYAAGNPFQQVEADNTPTPYQDLTNGYKTAYTHATFKGGREVTREMMDDDLYNVMSGMMTSLGREGKAFYDKELSKVFKNAFTATSTSYGDGKPLCSTAHPRGDGGTAQSNASSTGAVLNEVNLKEAILDLQEVKDHAGELIEVGTGTLRLIIPPALRHDAMIITESELRPGTGNNDTNVFYSSKYNLEVVENPWISARNGGSDTAWFLQDAEMHSLKMFIRVPLEFKSEFGVGSTFDTDSMKFKGYTRFSYGWSSWLGFWGSKGDGVAYAG